MTVIISSHLLSEIEQMASQVGIIHHGQLLYEGPLKDLECNGKSLEEAFLEMTGGKESFMNTLSNIPKIVSIEFQKARHKHFLCCSSQLCFWIVPICFMAQKRIPRHG